VPAPPRQRLSTKPPKITEKDFFPNPGSTYFPLAAGRQVVTTSQKVPAHPLRPSPSVLTIPPGPLPGCPPAIGRVLFWFPNQTWCRDGGRPTSRPRCVCFVFLKSPIGLPGFGFVNFCTPNFSCGRNPTQLLHSGPGPPLVFLPVSLSDNQDRVAFTPFSNPATPLCKRVPLTRLLPNFGFFLPPETLSKTFHPRPWGLLCTPPIRSRPYSPKRTFRRIQPTQVPPPHFSAFGFSQVGAFLSPTAVHPFCSCASSPATVLSQGSVRQATFSLRPSCTLGSPPHAVAQEPETPQRKV